MNKDDLLLLPETNDPVELREQFQQLIRHVEAENWCTFDDDSGYSEMMARRGISQLDRFVRTHRAVLPENYQEQIERLYY